MHSLNIIYVIERSWGAPTFYIGVFLICTFFQLLIDCTYLLHGNFTTDWKMTFKYTLFFFLFFNYKNTGRLHISSKWVEKRPSITLYIYFSKRTDPFKNNHGRNHIILYHFHADSFTNTFFCYRKILQRKHIWQTLHRTEDVQIYQYL